MAASNADRDVQELLKQLERDVEEIRVFPQDQMVARKKAAVVANASLKKMNAALNAFRKAVNATEDPIQKAAFKKRLDEYTKRRDGLKMDIAALTKPLPKGLKTADQRDQEAIFGQDEEMNSAGGVMNAAVRAQRVNVDILTEVEREAHVIKDTGDAIANQLAMDDEKINELDKDLNTLQANLNAAKGEVMWFARQMATDKCFIFLIFAIILGLAVLVFWKIYSGRASASSATPTPTPLATSKPVAPPPPSTAQAVTAVAAALVEAIAA